MYVLSEELKKMAESVIDEFPKFEPIKESGVRIAYAESDKRKAANGKITYGDCQKVNAKMKLLSNYDFLVTFYLDAMELPEKQKRILMEHELMHIGIGEQGGLFHCPA